jgi:integrase
MSIKYNPKRPTSPWLYRGRTLDGRQFTRSFATKKEAKEYAAQVLVDKRRGSFMDPQNASITFAAFGEQWLSSRRRRIGAKTLEREEGIFRLHLQPSLGPRQMGSIRRQDVVRLVDDWSDSGLSPRTIRRHVAVLTNIFNLAVAEEIIVRSPVAKVDLPRAQDPHRRPLTKEECRALLAAVEPAYRPLMYIALTTGLRWGELRDLNIGDLDWSDKTLQIRKAKTEAGVRSITLSTTDIAVINGHLVESGRTMAERDEPLFISHRRDQNGRLIGTRLNYSNFRSRVFRPAAEKIGLPDLTFHDTRRTAVTLLVSGGVPLKAVQARLGHRDVRTTLNFYAQATQQDLRAAAEFMEQVLAATSSPPLAAVADGA